MKAILNLILIVSFASNFACAQSDSNPPAKPSGFKGVSYELHADLLWDANSESDLAGYKIYKWNGAGYSYFTSVEKSKNYLTLFHGSIGISGKYKLTAYDYDGNESELSDSVETLTKVMTDEEFLDMVQLAAFRYFWDYADPNSGLARERYPNDPTCTIGGSGFGVMAILVGIERGFISREQGIERFLKILTFLTTKADKFHGALPHWIDGTTGKVIPFGEKDDGGDIVETSFMIQGLLAAKQYFKNNSDDEIQIRNMINQLWEGVDWNFYSRPPYGTSLYWNWSPNYEWAINLKLQGWNETLITYLLAVASPSHPVPAELYHTGFASGQNFVNINSYYGYRLYLGKPYGGPLFFAHYSFLGFDPRGIRDKYANYFQQNVNHTLINREYCAANTRNFTGYGENNWGLTASYSIPGEFYKAHEPVFNDNGTIAPTAALSSMPYTPQESIEALKYFYRTYKNKLWGDFGFKDAFNLTYSSKGVPGEWFSDGYLAIDQGPIIVMIENYRSELLWKFFMMNEEITPALEAIGFYPDTTTSLTEVGLLPADFELFQNYPNPFNPSTTISFNVPDVDEAYYGFTTLKIYDILGKEITTLVNGIKHPGFHNVNFDAGELSSGVYYYTLSAGGFRETKKMMFLK